MNTQDDRKILVIIGSTGVGKSDCAYRVAKALDGEIVSIDSRYLYRGMDIGTAKPDLQMRKTIPHHLVDVADPDENWSLALFQTQVLEALESIFKRNKLPILVGGTGQYYRAIMEGWQPPSVPPNPFLRQILEQFLASLPSEERTRRLACLDPKSAEEIDPRNIRRMVRAFEVIFSSGKPFSQQRRGRPIQYPTLVIGLSLPRDELYERCDQRIYRMIEGGWIDEVQRLLSRGYTPDLPSFSAIGYREIAAYLNGSIPFEQVIEQIKRRTRSLIRRQATWFRADDPTIHWYVAREKVHIEILEAVEQWLKAPSRFRVIGNE